MYEELLLFEPVTTETAREILSADKLFAEMELEGGAAPMPTSEFERRMRMRTVDEDRIQATLEYYEERYPHIEAITSGCPL